MMTGTYFKPVIGDDTLSTPAAKDKVEKIVFCSGKHYYELNKQRTKQGKDDVAIIRLEVRCSVSVKVAFPLLKGVA